jgi:hypothetical protein
MTTANAWGILAMEKFSARFESEPVTGSTTVTLGDQRGEVHDMHAGLVEKRPDDSTKQNRRSKEARNKCRDAFRITEQKGPEAHGD